MAETARQLMEQLIQRVQEQDETIEEQVNLISIREQEGEALRSREDTGMHRGL